MSDLARELGLPSPLATRVADELVARGLVERGADPDDRRRVLLRVTGQGRETFAAVHDEAEDLVSAVLSRMTEDEAGVTPRRPPRLPARAACAGRRRRASGHPGTRARLPDGGAAMSHAHARGLRASSSTAAGLYDLAFGWFIRRSDAADPAACGRRTRRPRPRRGHRPRLPGAGRVAAGRARRRRRRHRRLPRDGRARPAPRGATGLDAPSTWSPPRRPCPSRTTPSTSSSAASCSTT